MPVIAEMKNPKDYNKALLTCMTILNASYLAFSLVVYRWCGAWVANPSLGVSLLRQSQISLLNGILNEYTECWSYHEKGGIWSRSD